MPRHETVEQLLASAGHNPDRLHRRVLQPGGARRWDRLTRGRRPGEIVLLSTLTDELDGGARWPEVANWDAVTDDLLQLVCDHAREADHAQHRA
ncbi:hypothetical protein ACFY1L_55770 [Streptomyces sp. NPDC001663]|uniref:hypothetical protein n=1 Tax=Streptomyces sp. NPDC001663 TaxID=3364597 RepID=UPI0036A17EFB